MNTLQSQLQKLNLVPQRAGKPAGDAGPRWTVGCDGATYKPLKGEDDTFLWSPERSTERGRSVYLTLSPMGYLRPTDDANAPIRRVCPHPPSVTKRLEAVARAVAQRIPAVVVGGSAGQALQAVQEVAFLVRQPATTIDLAKLSDKLDGDVWASVAPGAAAVRGEWLVALNHDQARPEAVRAFTSAAVAVAGQVFLVPSNQDATTPAGFHRVDIEAGERD